MTSIFGHGPMRARLRDLIGRGQFPQTSLFYGQAGCGKKRVAFECAQILLCAKPVGQNETLAACEECASCKIFGTGNHPDFHVVEPLAPKSASEEAPAKSSSRGTIRVEQIQDIKQKISFPAMMGQRQVVIIDNAEQMSTVTANSLLKILEEPRANQIFILVTGQLSRLLITIRSRAAKIHFPNLDRSDVLAILKEQDASLLQNADLEFFIECFPGSPTHVQEAARCSLTAADLARLLDAPPTLTDINARIKPALSDVENLQIPLQMFRHILIRRAEQGEVGIRDLEFFDRLARAEQDLARHLSVDTVLERIFL